MELLAELLVGERDPDPGDSGVALAQARVAAVAAPTVTVEWVDGGQSTARYLTSYAPAVDDWVAVLRGGSVLVLGKIA